MTQQEERVGSRQWVVLLALLLCLLAAVLAVEIFRAFAPSAPTPVIRPEGLPANPTVETSARFRFTDSKQVTFECALDRMPFVVCGSGSLGTASYRGPLPAGTHSFGWGEVRCTHELRGRVLLGRARDADQWIDCPRAGDAGGDLGTCGRACPRNDEGDSRDVLEPEHGADPRHRPESEALAGERPARLPERSQSRLAAGDRDHDSGTRDYPRPS